MNEMPEVILDGREIEAIVVLHDRFGNLESVEETLLDQAALPGSQSSVLEGLRLKIAKIWQENDHVVLRQVPPSQDGVTGLIAASLCFTKLKRYRGGKVVKHFRMSPWTKALSHTLTSGFFHTDLNTADIPPAATVMQCLDPDPGAPEYGQLRVARLADLVSRLRKSDLDTASFLLGDTVTMVNENSPTGWVGTMVRDGLIRFHPESLVAAWQLTGKKSPKLDDHLATIHKAALDVSVPISLEPGEMLLVSNRRALHQRGACTVRFEDFPSKFESRRVSVFHAHDEPV